MPDEVLADPETVARADRLRARVTRQALLMTLVLAIAAGAAIWLLVFDMWLGQVERQYLWENARHQLNIGPAVSLKAMMDEGRAAGSRVATGWGLMVAGAIAATGLICYRRGMMAGHAIGARWTHSPTIGTSSDSQSIDPP